MKDENIIPFLLNIRQPTFFTLDADFYKKEFCHRKYGLVYLSVDQYDSALFILRLIRHSNFNSVAKRMGRVIRASENGLTVWQPHQEREVVLDWSP